MSKMQKVWLAIFLAMFVVPEVLWSPVVNLVYSLLQNSNHAQIFRSNFLTSSDNTNFLLSFLILQLVGIVGCLGLIFQAKINTGIKIFLIFVLILLLLITGAVFYIAFSLRKGIGF
jgi:hypothetical protein